MKLLFLTLLLLFSLPAAVLAQDAAQTAVQTVAQTAPAAPTDQPPGQRYDVEGVSLYLSCLGEGSPTIVIDAGMGEWSLHWLGIQQSLAAITRTCVYDRAGYGYSAASARPRDAEHIVEDLHALLTAAGVMPPYVLLGHSMGGVYARLFASEHREEVAGLVLVDTINPAAQPLPAAFQSYMAESFASFPQLASLAAQGMILPDQMPIPDYIPDSLGAQYQRQTATESFFSTLYSEFNATDASLEAISGISSFGDLPLVVIAAGLADIVPDDLQADMNAFNQTVWQPAQAAMAGLSSNGQLIVAANSHHHIQFDAPQVIVDAVGALLASTAGRQTA